jgi:hypothetical protein
MIIISDLASLVAAATHSQQYCSFPPVNMPRPWIDCQNKKWDVESFMTESIGRLMGSNVLKKTRASCQWLIVLQRWPNQATVQLKNS